MKRNVHNDVSTKDSDRTPAGARTRAREELTSDVVSAMVEDARAAGYAEGRAAARVKLALLADELRMMPEALVDAYAALCVGAMTDGMEGRGAGGDLRVKPRVTRARTSTNQQESRGLPQRVKPPVARGGVEVRSLRLMALKSRVDRKLRSLAREIQRELEGGGKGDIRKCTRCGRYGEETWAWCPWDAAPMASDDPR